jgi:very-short-patch-repair endonuclease
MDLASERTAAGPRGQSADVIARHIADLGCGECATFIGVDSARVSQALRSAETATCSALMLATRGVSTIHVLDIILDDLAQLALSLWPNWYGESGGQAGAFSGAGMSFAWGWRRFAPRLAANGRIPRFRRMPAAIEFSELVRAIDPRGVVLIADIDPVSENRARAEIDALEWCAARGASVVFVSAAEPSQRSPWDRLLHGAFRIESREDPVHDRFIAAPSRAHPASAIEQRVESALKDDPELGPLFACNVSIPIKNYGSPRVDLFWREGRVVVELDGPEHQGNPKFHDDRHRDYELLVAGHLVLRITNEQVETDLRRAIEKIRAVVRLRKTNVGLWP